MDEDAYVKIVMYLEDNGESDTFKFELMQEADEIIKISKWDYQLKKPEPADLNYDPADVQEEKEKEKNSSKCSSVLVVNSVNKLKNVKEGMMVYNKSTGKLQVYVDNSWKSFLPIL